MTTCRDLNVRFQRKKWRIFPCENEVWLGAESNRRHEDFQSAALPTGATQPFCPGTGDDVLIGGITVRGTATEQVLFRRLGLISANLGLQTL